MATPPTQQKFSSNGHAAPTLGGLLRTPASSGVGGPVDLPAEIIAEAVRAAAKSNSRIEQALWWDLLVAGAVERERVVSLGRRTAPERLGHLFCELHLRLAMAGLVERLRGPLSQVGGARVLPLQPPAIRGVGRPCRGSSVTDFTTIAPSSVTS